MTARVLFVAALAVSLLVGLRNIAGLLILLSPTTDDLAARLAA